MSFGLFLRQARSGVSEALSASGLEAGFEVGPARPGFGDAACNAPFLLAKKEGRSPRDIAETLASRYRPDGLVLWCRAHPSGYLNFGADAAALASGAVRAALDGTFGIEPAEPVPTVVEHTSVNPNKELHIGHVRNVVIGDCVSRILARAGRPVSVLNYVDDSGLQVADVVIGIERLGLDPEPPGGVPFDRHCGELYARTTAAYEQDPGLKAERGRVLGQMESGGNPTASLAESVTRRVLECQLRTCWRLGASYDCINYESQILRSGMWGSFLEDMKQKSLAVMETEGDNAGCWVLRGHGKVLVRSGGTATYTAKDMPYAAWKLGLVSDPFGYAPYPGQPGRQLWQSVLGGGRRKNYSGRRVITVVDSRQSAPQAMVRSVMDVFLESGGSYVHLSYGPVGLSAATAGALGAGTGGRGAQMSGRRGLYVGADEVCDTLEERALAEVARRNPGMDGEEARAIARQVALGTLRYEMIRPDLDRPITFDLERSLSLEGDTAPYIQYAHARACRILEKAPARPDPGSMSPQQDGPERALVVALSRMGVAVSEAERNLSPKVVARYCRELAVEFNSFYERARVVGTDARTDNLRLCLVDAFRLTVSSALGLLGIGAPARM